MMIMEQFMELVVLSFLIKHTVAKKEAQGENKQNYVDFGNH